MSLDLSSLANAIVSLDDGLGVVGNTDWLAAQPQAVRHTLIAGVIQQFEFVYELSIKMLRRRLEMDAATPTDVDYGSFRDLLRLAAERGLIADIEAWFRYRQMRNITSHTYDQDKAQQVCAGVAPFIVDARALLQGLVARNA
ncbi:MAG: hypothetical protein HW416_2846 [Chloroflexi bacterium]|nr:hypothetical protein [Chloroflexota bacterium]